MIARLDCVTGRRCWIAPAVVACCSLAQAQDLGIDTKRPVFGGACKICPWGAAAEIVKAAMAPYGYEVQICYNCSTAEAPRIVAGARRPPSVEAAWQRSPRLREQIPAPPDGPVDFGAVGVKFLWDAYRGVGAYAREAPRQNLRLIATIQSPTYLIVAVRKELGTTDLAQLQERRRPLRILGGTGQEASQVLAYFGLTREHIRETGGEIVGAFAREGRSDFDVIIGEGTITTAPEFDYWNEISQKVELTYVELPEALLAQLAKDNERQRANIPNGLLRGIARPISTVAVSGIAIYGRDDMPDSFAYDAAKALDEHQDLLQWSHLNMSYNLRNVWQCFGVPLHSGAQRYYRERKYMP